jgi:superfamily II DNA/RNA helicase
VFTRTKRTAAKVSEELVERGFAAGALHGDLGQGAREQALRAFRNGKVDILVATDVAARGIDVENVTHVINYQTPEDEKTYLHRTGRTGRAGQLGTAITFVDWDDVPHWALINKALELGIPEPIETYSSSPHLYTDLDIPEGTKGRLPKEARTRAGLDAEELEDLGETGKRTSRSSDRGGRSGRDGSRDTRGRSQRGGSGDRDRKSAASEDKAPTGEKSERPKRQRNRTRRVNGEVSATATATEASGEKAEGSSASSTEKRRSRTRTRRPAQSTGETQASE